MPELEPMTEKQIESWRNILLGMVGSYALIMPKEQIQTFRDTMQEQLKGEARCLN